MNITFRPSNPSLRWWWWVGLGKQLLYIPRPCFYTLLVSNLANASRDAGSRSYSMSSNTKVKTLVVARRAGPGCCLLVLGLEEEEEEEKECRCWC